MENIMRKIVTLCTLVLMSISPLAFAQSVEDTITLTVTQSADTSTAYEQLISEDDETLNAEQKAALAAMGSEAGIAFLNAVASGSSLNDAALIVLSTVPGSSEPQVVAFLNTFPDGATDIAGVGSQTSTEQPSEDSGLLTDTGAGPGTNTGTGAPVGGTGTGAAGGGGGGVTASTN